MNKNVWQAILPGLIVLGLVVHSSSISWGGAIVMQGDPSSAIKGQAKNDIKTNVIHNRWETYMTNKGQLVGSGTNYGGYWPAGSGQNYIYGAGLWVGADIGGIKHVTVGYNPNDGTCEFTPSAVNGDTTNDATALLYITGQSNWPLHKTYGGDSVVSALDTYTKFDDWNLAAHASGDTPLKIKVSQTSYAWEKGYLKDVVFFVFEVQNTSGDSLKNVYLGSCFDNDIGYEGGSSANDRVTFDAARNMGIQFQTTAESGWDTTGVVGVRFFESPVCTRSSVQIVDNQYPRIVSQGQQLGMTTFKIFTMDIDPLTDNDRHLVMQGYNYNTMVLDAYDEGGVAFEGDKRFIMCSGPFDMKPDTMVRIVVGIVAATDTLKLKRASDFAQGVYNDHFAGIIPITVTAPNLQSVLSGTVNISWNTAVPSCTTDIYYSGDGGVNWNLLASGQPGSGTYAWNTSLVPDGVKYKVAVYSYNETHFGWDESDEMQTVNNAGNVSPTVSVPSWGEAPWTGTRYTTFYYGDADNDQLTKMLTVQKMGWSTTRWDTIAMSSGYAQYWSTDSFGWNTIQFPNYYYYARIGIDDGSHAVAETSVVEVYNEYPPVDSAVQVSGTAKWATITPYVVDPPQLTGHIYEYRFKPLGGYLSGTTYMQIVSFDLWDLTENHCALSDQAFSVRMFNDYSGSTGYFGADCTDGLVPEVRWSYLMNQRSDSFKITNDVGSISMDTLAVYPADTNLSQTPKWMFRGCNYEIRWHVAGTYPNDTLTAEVWDMDNNLPVPLDTSGFSVLTQSAWSFGAGSGSGSPGRSIITNGITSLARKYLFVCGTRCFFNRGATGTVRNMTWATHPGEGEIWKLYTHGPKPPRDGDVYRFQGALGVTGNLNRPSSLFALQPNRPNPFNKTTTIQYQLPTRCSVDLTVYNINGQRVKTLVSGKQDPGMHAINWDGRNDAGQRLSAGIYLYRLQADDKTTIKKLILIR